MSYHGHDDGEVLEGCDQAGVLFHMLYDSLPCRLSRLQSNRWLFAALAAQEF
jgi:hypothetical protein